MLSLAKLQVMNACSLNNFTNKMRIHFYNILPGLMLFICMMCIQSLLSNNSIDADIPYDFFSKNKYKFFSKNESIKILNTDSEIDLNFNEHLIVSKTASPMIYNKVGTEVSYRIVVENAGSTVLKDIVVTDPLIKLEYTIDRLVRNQAQEFVKSYFITESDVFRGSVSNKVLASAIDSKGSIVSSEDEVTILFTQIAGLTITKTATPVSFAEVDEEISYVIKIENIGDVTVSNVTVSDPLTGLNRNIGNLAPGSDESVTTSHTITQADIDRGSVSNMATASGTDPEGALVTAEDGATITGIQKTGLTVTKSASPTSYNAVGTEITYTIEVENTGNVNVSNVSVSDPLTGLNRNIGSLAPGEDESITTSYNITQADIDRGSVSNTATASGTGPGGALVTAEGNATITGTQNAGLTVTKSASPTGYNAVGAEITYTIEVENTGNVNVSNITVSDPLTGLNRNIGSLAPGSDESITTSYNITQADIDRGSVSNTATASGTGAGGASVTAEGNATITGTQNAGLTVTKRASPTSYNAVGTEITYTIEVENTGNVNVSNVTVSDPLTGLNRNIGSLAPGEDESITTSYTITQADIDRGSVSNTATASGTGAGGASVTAEGNATITGTQNAGLTVTKSASPPSYNAVGAEITYTIEVENTGNVNVSNVTVSDPLTGLNRNIGSLAPGSVESVTTSYTITQADIDRGSVSNTATASGTGAGGASVTAEGNASITGTQNAGLAVTKSASPTSYNAVGTEISYTIEVQNTGNVNVSNVTVSDPLTGLNRNIGSLAPGEDESVTTSYTITQADIDRGSVSNTATASGTGAGGGLVSAEDKAIVTGTLSTGISLELNASPSSFNEVGDEISYTIIIENTGNVTLSEVIVTDERTGIHETIDSFAPGAKQTFTATYNVIQTDLNMGSIPNTASVTGKGPGGSIISDNDFVEISAIQNPQLTVNKNATKENFTTVGEEISWTIIVENTGNVVVTDILITDPLVGLNESIGNLNPGEIRSYTPSYLITQVDLSNGNVINIVKVTGNYLDESFEIKVDETVTALLPPVANDDESSDHISGNIVTINILENDFLGDGSKALPGLVRIDLNSSVEGFQTEFVKNGEGVWRYNPQNGQVTFTPESGFTTDPTEINYIITEISTDLSDAATIRVDYNEGEPFAFNDISSGNIPGNEVVLNILANDKLSDGSQVLASLVTLDLNPAQAGIQTELIVTGEGTWSLNIQTGDLRFTPLAGYTTNPTPIVYSLTENLTGLTDNGTVIISYDEVPPVAADDVSAGHEPGEIVTFNILSNDQLSDGSPALAELVTLDLDLSLAGIQDDFVVSGEGTWRLNSATGEVTFSPIAGFTADTKPVTYRLTENLTGLYDTASIIVIYNDEPPVAVDDSSIGNEPGTEVSIKILENDLLSDGTPALLKLVIVDIDPLKDGIQHELVVPEQGIWQYNQGSGTLTFTPQIDFFSNPTPVIYSLCSVWNTSLCDEASVIVEYDLDVLPASLGFIKAGMYNIEEEIIYYSFEITNTGKIPVWDIVIIDERIGINNLTVAPDTLQPGGTALVSATYEVTQDEKNEGSVTNSARVIGFTHNGKRIEDISGSAIQNDEPTVTLLDQVPSISVEKEAVLFSLKASLNEVVDFRITAVNNGNVILEEVRVEDPLTGFEQEVGSLLPGETVVLLTNYIIQPEDDLNGEFENTAIVRGTAPDGSIVEDSHTITIEVESCGMVIPTGFSPNGDGIQDTWRITCLDKYPDARIEVFNRWGNRVFEKDKYGNSDVHGRTDAWWDGYSTNKGTFGNSILPAGTYYYILYLMEGQEPISGFVFLNR